jgi:two-component system, NtrC family, response regulator AtoC
MDHHQILVVDDDENILYAFREVLEKDGFIYQEARDGIESLQMIRKQVPDVIFMDINMPRLDGLEVLKKIKEHDYSVPVIVITGQGTMQTAIQAMKQGAFQYLIKPLSVNTIREEIKKAIVSSKSAKIHEFSFEIDTSKRHQLIGNSPLMHDIYKVIGSISASANHASVFITGESGTGKELVARAIHYNSSFPREPFVAINCTAIPETLLESELFGSEKGAFTGATDRRIGKFELAGEGTIFLDEIGDLSVNLQHKLLRVLQEREFERVGGNELIQVKARFIAATNQNIEKKVKSGLFREDLLYRLNVLTVKIPPLRRHPEDIPLLANFFLLRYKQRIRRNIYGISQEAMEKLQSYHYPGNVRELENIIERGIMLTTGRVILPEVLGELSTAHKTETFTLPLVSPVYEESRQYLLEAFEKQFVKEKLAKHHGNISAAARESKMSRQNFHRLVQKYDFQLKE